MAVLDIAARKNLDKSQFAVPEKAPGSGSYPIPDRAHAANALARSAGKPEEGKVRAAVQKKFPGIGVQGKSTNIKPKTPVKDRIGAALKHQKTT